MKKLIFRILLGLLFVGFLIFLGSELFLKPTVDKHISTLQQQVLSSIRTHQTTYTPLSHISLLTQEAAISSQNERFYSDTGISFLGTARAVTFSLFSKNRQGASTITEQLAKNVYFQGKDNLKTDILTKLYALYMTRMYPKKTLLAYYLNVIYFGRNAYGITSASRIYFQTTPDKLSLPQSAYLLGLIDAPSYLANHPPAAKQQAFLVLQTMERDAFITPSEEKAAYTALATF